MSPGKGNTQILTPSASSGRQTLLSSTRLLTARGMTRLLREEVAEAKSVLEEAISQSSADDEAVVAYARVRWLAVGTRNLPEQNGMLE